MLLPGESFYSTLKKIEKKMSHLAAQVSLKQDCKERKLISLKPGFAAATPSSVLGCFICCCSGCTSEQCVNHDSELLQLHNSCV